MNTLNPLTTRPLELTVGSPFIQIYTLTLAKSLNNNGKAMRKIIHKQGLHVPTLYHLSLNHLIGECQSTTQEENTSESTNATELRRGIKTVIEGFTGHWKIMDDNGYFTLNQITPLPGNTGTYSEISNQTLINKMRLEAGKSILAGSPNTLITTNIGEKIDFNQIAPGDIAFSEDPQQLVGIVVQNDKKELIIISMEKSENSDQLMVTPLEATNDYFYKRIDAPAELYRLSTV